MKQLVDFDALFDEKLSEYMQKHAGEFNEKQWEDIIPKLYQQFGDMQIASLGTTPRGYYAEMTDDELVDSLCRHVREGVPVPDFLCRELEERKCAEALIPLLSDESVELQTFAANTVGPDERAFGAYFDLLKREDADEDVVETVVEQLKAEADGARERALAFYRDNIRPDLMLEILSRTKARDEEVFSILLDAFRTSEEIPMHASYLAAYGDARALPVLLDVIDRDDINYLEYQELKFAIEALGGEYTRPRDFSEDEYFKEIMEQSRPVSPDEN